MTEPEAPPAPGAQPPGKEPRPRASAYAVLAVAVLVAIGAGTYLLLSDESGNSRSSLIATDQARAALANGALAPNTGVFSPQRPKEGEIAPDFGLVDARNPSLVRKLSDFRGKAVVLNWYASWCGPCKQEIPEFQAAQDALGDQVVFLGIDFLESAGDATGILDSLHATYPAVLDSSGTVADHYRVGQGGGGLPTTFFVDKDGILRATTTGRVTREALEQNLAKAGVIYKAP